MIYRLLPALVLVLAGATAVVNAADSHDHHGTQHALHLDNGKKWATDDPLRKGMTNVRNLVDNHVHKSHGKAASNADYDALASNVQKELNFIIKNCRLSKEADAVLHAILSDVMHGMSVLEGKQQGVKREAGATHIAHALENYAKYFDHPGWVGVALH